MKNYQGQKESLRVMGMFVYYFGYGDSSTGVLICQNNKFNTCGILYVNYTSSVCNLLC